MERKKMKWLKVIGISIMVLLIVVFGGFFVYSLDYYKADEIAQKVMEGNEEQVVSKDNLVFFYPEEEKDSNTALIFYPGGKVEASAYAPLLEQISQEGITCVLVKMPFHLAVFGVNAADDIYKELPNIKNWYIGGHSLGGAMASSYVAKNKDKIKGIIFLAAYPVETIDIPMLALYGSKDLVLTKEKLEPVENKIEIIGGNHAYYGNYGEQKGDGTATITREEQQEKTVEEIVTFME